MRKLKIFILSSIIICCLSALATLTACGASVDTPTNLYIDSDTLVLSWDSVSGAESYTVSIDGDLNYTLSTSYDLTYLDAGTYTIRVKSADGAYESGWSELITFTRESENGLIYKLINNSTEYEVSNIGTATGDIIVPEYFRGKKVTAIGDKAFKNKTKITSITLTDNITSIGDEAFYGCSNLVSIDITDSVTEIGSSAFYNCVKLVLDFTAPEGITEISEYMFYNCQAITGFTITENVTTIGAYAFWKCNSLTEIIIPDNVTYIGEKAFANCSGVTNIEVGDGVTEMGEYVFEYCTSLENVSLSSRLTVLSRGTFMYCSGEGFTSIVLPDSITVINSYAFYCCSNLTDITIGDNVTDIYGYAFSGTGAYSAAEEAGEMLYVGNWLISVINPTETSYGVTDFKDGLVGVATYAFYQCTSITSIVFSYELNPENDTLKYIGQSAFYECTGLRSVTLGSAALSVGQNAFYGCSSLKNVFLGAYDTTTFRLGESNVKTIGRYAFAQCTSLTQIEIPESVTSIGAFAFYGSGIWPEDSTATVIYAGTIEQSGVSYGCKWLVGSSCLGGTTFAVVFDEDTVGLADYAFAVSSTSSAEAGLVSVYMNDSIKYIGDAAFYGCIYLQYVSFPAGIEEINDYMFYRCEQLVSITIPDTVTRIGTGAFAYCYYLGYYNEDCTIVIPSNVEVIGDYAFFGCGAYVVDEEGNYQYDENDNIVLVGASTIKVESDNVVIGEAAFAYFISLKNVEMCDGVTDLGADAFFGCTYLETVSLGTGLTEIKDRTFYKCESLTSITIPDNIVSIGDKAFYKNYSLTSVTLGSGVTSIGDYAFYYCTSLATINFPSSLNSIGTQAFRSCTSLKSIAVSGNLKEIGDHAFYGCNTMAVYMASGADSSAWSDTWNSSYRPIVYNCSITSSGYVSSITLTDGQYSYVYSGTQLTDPARTGYTFVGWSTSIGAGTAEYGWDDLADLDDGTTLYAVWVAE